MFMNFVHSCIWQLFLKNKRWDENVIKMSSVNHCYKVLFSAAAATDASVQHGAIVQVNKDAIQAKMQHSSI